MKNTKLTILTAILITLGFALAVYPCDIFFKNLTEGDVTKGDIFILEISVKLTHRVCNLGPEDTKFETEGLKILAATKWKEKGPGKSQRKLKVEATKAGKASLTAIRDCKKDGGMATFEIEVKE